MLEDMLQLSFYLTDTKFKHVISTYYHSWYLAQLNKIKYGFFIISTT
jgi:hypothetical protein